MSDDPWKFFAYTVYIEITIFTHIDNTQSTGYK